MDGGFGRSVGSHAARLKVKEWIRWESYSLGYGSYDHILNIIESDIKEGVDLSDTCDGLICEGKSSLFGVALLCVLSHRE